MDILLGLKQLGEQIARLETHLDRGKLIMLSNEYGEAMAQNIIEGLLRVHPLAKNIKVEASFREYRNQLAILALENNQYTLSVDNREVFISAINDFTCRITPESHGLLVYHQDSPGVVLAVSRKLALHRINISSMNVSREQKGKAALLVSITDDAIPASILPELRALPLVTRVCPLQ